MAKFRFEDLEIWKEAIEIGMIFFDIADELEEKNSGDLQINVAV